MSYPVINGALINGADDGGDSTTASLRPVKIGVPTFMATNTFPAQSLSPVTISGQQFKTGSDLKATPESIRPVRIGMTGFLAGMPPDNIVFPAQSLVPVSLGAHTLSMAIVHAATSLTPASHGTHMWSTAYPATPLSPVLLGNHSAVSSFGDVESLRPVTVGNPGMSSMFPASSLYAAKIGDAKTYAGGLLFSAQSLTPVSIGVPDEMLQKYPASSLRPARIGVHIFDRGATC